jgi:amylosucrase
MLEATEQSVECLKYLYTHIDMSGLSARKKRVFEARLEAVFPELYGHYVAVYGTRPIVFHHLSNLLQTLIDNFADRSTSLAKTDAYRQEHPRWFRSQNMVGMACYVDLVADDIRDLETKIPYFLELGINYLHLMPLYKSPEGDSDGGYAVSDYRQVNPSLGTMSQLKSLAKKLQQANINLVLDFVFNHTADDHHWALKAKSGDKSYQDFYFMFPDRVEPDQFDTSLREIFPSVRRGSFSFVQDVNQWVWTTFNNFQWDLNYGNPDVFNHMVSEMLFLSNLGCDVLRLDALAFIWKEKGTVCENLPKAHTLIKAFNACLRIVAPGVLLKSEAIVHPSEVVKYIGEDECQISYNPLLMALVWNSLATRKTRLLKQSLSHRFAISEGCAWVNYARCHDDIGWTFDDDDAGHIGINGYDHRLFLNKFFVGDFPGSFSQGRGFQYNPDNGDCRVCGSLASLCGLEEAIELGDQYRQRDAIARIKLVHSIIMSIGGIPLLYQGDELATLNDYSYEDDQTKSHDARWVNRPLITEHDRAKRYDKTSAASAVFNDLKTMISIRKSLSLMGEANTEIHVVDHENLFAYTRAEGNERLHCLVNFSESSVPLNTSSIPQIPASAYTDLLTSSPVVFGGVIELKPYQVLWLK